MHSGRSEATGPLIEGLHNDGLYPQSRAEIYYTLGCFGTDAKAAISTLSAAVRLWEQEESQVALHALMRIAPREEATLCVVRETICNDKRPLGVRILGCLELSDLGDTAQASVPEMMRLFDSLSGEMPLQIPKQSFLFPRHRLIRRASTLKTATLKELEEDFDEHPRVNILIAIGHLGPCQVGSASPCGNLGGSHGVLRCSLVFGWCLQQMGAEAKPAFPTLVAIFKGADQDTNLRREAATALTAIGSEGIAQVIKALDSSEWTTKLIALEALENIGPRAKAALPAIQEIQRGDDRLLAQLRRLRSIKFMDSGTREEAIGSDCLHRLSAQSLDHSRP